MLAVLAMLFLVALAGQAQTDLPPTIISQPASLVRNAGLTAYLNVAAAGTAPLAYQWFKGEVLLEDSEKMGGTQTDALALNNLLQADAGGYRVVITNAFGSVTSQVAVLSVNDPAILTHPADLAGQPGRNAQFTVVAGGTPPLSCQWLKDGQPLANGGRVSGATSFSLAIQGLTRDDLGAYSALVRNPLGSVTSQVALLSFNLAALDAAFSPQPNEGISALALQVDGKLVVGGWFTSLGGQPRNRLGRLQADGTVDASFNTGADWYVHCLALQGDGRILVGGEFSQLGGQPREGLGRLNADGTLDATFNPSPASAGGWSAIYCLAPQADGKILVGGSFTTIAGQPRNNLARLNTDGTVDSTFDPGAGGSVYALAIQEDGKILVGGRFTTLGTHACGKLGRLQAEGTVDVDFNPGIAGDVRVIVPQPDGAIIVGGEFTVIGGEPRNKLARLKADGTLDAAYHPEAAPGRSLPWSTVYAAVPQADGKLLVGGAFSTLAGEARACLGRLHPDGSADATFNPAPGGCVYALAVQADGQVLVGGGFASLDGQPCPNLGRLRAVVPATQQLVFDASGTTWLRGGSSPELSRATCEFSQDGLAWTSPAAGKRVAGGWRLAEVTPPAGSFLRVRGEAATGGKSGWFFEILTGPPLGVSIKPVALTVNFAGSATFQASASGTGPFNYQWLKDGVPLADGGHISGSATATLALKEVGAEDRGAYHVVVTNAYGTAASPAATLAVKDPVILVQPVSDNKNPGLAATFSVTVGGTGPFVYQWFKDGVPLADGGKFSGAQASTLRITDLLKAEAGTYRLEVSNPFDSVTSQGAILSVNDPLVAKAPVGLSQKLGEPVELSITMAGTGPFDYQWYKDGLLVQQTTGGSFTDRLAIPALRPEDAGRYWVAVSNPYNHLTSNPVSVTINSTAPDPAFNPGANGAVNVLLPLPDGRILLGGEFTQLGKEERRHLGCVNQDGTLASEFEAEVEGGAYPFVNTLALQADGKILVGGNFTKLGGDDHPHLGRLRPDGSVDESFHPESDGEVYALAVQLDGRILVGGHFYKMNGRPRWSLARLQPDGSLDDSFSPAANDFVFTLVQQPDGKILVGGGFLSLGGYQRNNLGRLLADGTVDTTFNPGASGLVQALALQADGAIVVGGAFAVLAGQSRMGLGRLAANGALDTTFNPGPDHRVNALAVQADGRLLVGGAFTRLGGSTRSFIARLQPSGEVDPSFEAQPNQELFALALQADGQLLVGGAFTGLGLSPIAYAGRLQNGDPAAPLWTVTPNRLVWRLGDTSPEFSRTAFEFSSDGSTWHPLGAGVRTASGWQLDNISLADGLTLRARGEVVTGGTGSWYLESIWKAAKSRLSLVVIRQPGGLALKITGPLGQPFTLDHTSDPAAGAVWQSRSLILNQSPLYLLEEQTAGAVSGFYRLRY